MMALLEMMEEEVMLERAGGVVSATLLTDTVTAEEVAVLPAVSRATAVRVCEPLAAVVVFRGYTREVLENAQEMAKGLRDGGIRLVTGGTDTHLLLADVGAVGMTGAKAEKTLASAGLITNKNPIPFDTQPALVGSGIRLGSPAITTRGLDRDECREVGSMVAEALTQRGEAKTVARIAARVSELTAQLPLFHKKWLPRPG